MCVYRKIDTCIIYMFIHIYICMTNILYSSVDGHLGCAIILEVVNNAAINIWSVCVFFN